MIGIERPEDWDEEAYLRENPDVAQFVRDYPETNGWEHFAMFGYRERRGGAAPELFDYAQAAVTGGPHDMDEDHQPPVAGADPIDTSTYLFPNELQVTNVPLKTMLLI